ncbi:MAG: hypothetical protein QXS68_03110 [Candidatus Methanomethylicaceae archaeon]
MSKEVTPVDEWKRPRQGELVTLPSGRVARIRRPNIDEMLLLGKIPNPLIPIVLGLVRKDEFEGVENLPDDVKAERMAALYKEFLLQMKTLCEAAFVEPRMSDDPSDEGAISFFDLTPEDRDFLWEWMKQPVTAVEGFRQGQT